MGPEDAEGIARFLLDPRVMWAWARDFSLEDVDAWIERSMSEHARWGYSLMTARLHSGAIIGRAGLRRDVIDGEEVVEAGWILARAFWGRGYAAELARALLALAPKLAEGRRVVAEIRPENAASVRVALRAGMKKIDSFVKLYRGRAMLHDVYAVGREEAIR